MEAEYTKIDNDLAVKARFLYNELGALDDLMLTIPYHPEKMYLLEAVKEDKSKIQSQIDDWWEKIAQITGKTFSDNAEVIFDMSVISD